MCGRTALTASPVDLREAFGLAEAPVVTPSYNVPPSRPVAVVRAGPGGERRLDMIRWGLLPPSVADPSRPPHASQLALARVETVATARTFRDLVRRRRCLVVVDGFYEWRRAGKTPSQPFFMRRRGGGLLALAGVWDRSASPVGERVVESCAILTQAARPPADAVHDRMPVVLEESAWQRWLDPAVEDVTDLLVAQTPALVAFSVSPHINDPRHDDATCVEPWEPAQRSLF